MIKNSVGRGGMNYPVDVKIVQRLLNKYVGRQSISYFKKLREDGVCGSQTINAIKIFQSNVVGLASPDARIDAGGVTIRKLQQYDNANNTAVKLPFAAIITTALVYTPKNPINNSPSTTTAAPKQPNLTAFANANTDPRQLKTREAVGQVYGTISSNKTWAEQAKYLRPFTIPQNVTSHKDYNWINVYDPKKRKVSTMWCNVSMHSFLQKAFTNLLDNNLISELKEYGGSHSIRATRGTTRWSAHSWALAIDLNMTENGLGVVPKLTKPFVKCFTDAGFGWGGYYSRQDGMHFTIAGFDMPSKQA